MNKHPFKYFALRTMIVLLVAVLASIIYVGIRVKHFVNAVFAPFQPAPFEQPSGEGAPASSKAPLSERLRRGERVTMLLLGYKGTAGEGTYLTDSMVLAGFDARTRTISLMNIPRDLWVHLPATNSRSAHWGKINEAYGASLKAKDVGESHTPYDDRHNGGQLAREVVAQVTGMTVDFWVSLDFDGFRRFIDALGGITVNVEKAFDDYHYPSHDNPSIDASTKHIHFDAGAQHMDGETALQYSRSRYAPQDGGDFSRSRRQAHLVDAIKDKLLRPETLPRALALLDSLQGHLRTSLTLRDFHALLDYAQGLTGAFPQVRTASTVINTDNVLQQSRSSTGLWILLPRAGQGNYSEIHQFVRRLYVNPLARLEDTRVQVQDGIGQPTTAARVTEMLADLGVTTVEPVPVTPQERTRIYDYTQGQAPETLRVVREALRAPVLPGLPDARSEVKALVVVIGRDYHGK